MVFTNTKDRGVSFLFVVSDFKIRGTVSREEILCEFLYLYPLRRNCRGFGRRTIPTNRSLNEER